jgi:peroxiredoxin
MEPGEQIELSANFDDPGYEYTVEGSSGSARILSINRVMAKLMDGLDSLNEVNNAATQQENYPTVRNKLDSAYRRHLEQTQNTLVGMLEEDPGNLTNLFIFPLGVGNQQLLPADKYFEQYESSLAAMEERYPENPHVLRFAQRMTQMQEQMEAQREFMQAEQNAAVGMPVPDMTMKDVDGKDRSLSDLKGKVVLVDFWAAWCRPCRAENPNVVKMYNRFHDRGFEIYSVSLDGLPNQPNAKDAWLNAIKDDGLIWENHVSDLQGWSSSAIGIYGFQSIPFTLLVDRDGIIIERGLRGPALENAIEKAL